MHELASCGLNYSQVARLTGVSRQVSKDIQELFCRSCRQLGVEYTFSGGRGREISVARAGGVARLDSFVGPKS